MSQLDCNKFNLEEAKYGGANFKGADFTNANFEDANCKGLNATGKANLENADLSQSNLSNVIMHKFLCEGSDFKFAEMKYSKFTGARIDSALYVYKQGSHFKKGYRYDLSIHGKEKHGPAVPNG